MFPLVRIGSLNYVTRLEVTVHETMYTNLKHLVAQMKELKELGLVCASTGLRFVSCFFLTYQLILLQQEEVPDHVSAKIARASCCI